MATKLARQMALKKKLEEEYRLANEKMNQKVTPTKRYHSMQFDFDAKPRYPPIEIRSRRSVIIEDVETNNVLDEIAEQEKIKRADEEAKRKELEERLRQEEEERLRREEEERIKRELEEKLRAEEEERRRKEELRRKKLEERQRRLAAKRRREERRAFEEREMEKIRTFMLDDRCENSQEEKERLRELEEAQYEEMMKTEQRIKQLETSIATLNFELERYDLEDMKDKTRKVVKRMSLVLKDVEDEEVDIVLKATTVTGFMENEDLWSQYMSQGISITH